MTAAFYAVIMIAKLRRVLGRSLRTTDSPVVPKPAEISPNQPRINSGAPSANAPFCRQNVLIQAHRRIALRATDQRFEPVLRPRGAEPCVAGFETSVSAGRAPATKPSDTVSLRELIPH